MGWAYNGARRNVDFAWIGLSIGDELGDRLGRNRWMHHHDVGHDNNAGDRRDVADEIEVELVIECRVERVRRSGHKELIAVRECTHDGLRGDITARAWPVLDDELLAEPLRQPLTDETRGDVGATGGGIADNQAHWPRRIGLRPRHMRHRRQRGSARGQMQEFAAGKFHLNLPLWRVYVFAPPGRRTVNTEPLPGSLATVTSPPIMRASLRERARPSPVPPKP